MNFFIISFIFLTSSTICGNVFTNEEEDRETDFIAIIIDEFTAERYSKNDSKHITEQMANDIFNLAVSYENRRKTHIYPYNGSYHFLKDGYDYLHRHVDYLPIFIHPDSSEEMFQKMLVPIESNPDVLFRGAIDVADCSVSGMFIFRIGNFYLIHFFLAHCVNIFNFQKRIAEFDVPLLTTCCFENHHTDEITDKKPQGPDIVNETLEPHSIVHLIYLLAMQFDWRRFHFLVSPGRESLDIFFDLLTEGIEEEEKLYSDRIQSGSLIVTKSFYCNEYLSHGKLCSDDQIQDIITNKATVIIALLDSGEDAPRFIEQIASLDTDDARLATGKGLILVHLNGVLSRMSQTLIEDAPPGLMILKSNDIFFEGFEVSQFIISKLFVTSIFLSPEFPKLAYPMELTICYI